MGRTMNGHTLILPPRDISGGPISPSISICFGWMPTSSCVSRRAAARKDLSAYTIHMFEIPIKIAIKCYDIRNTHVIHSPTWEATA